jgi:sugar phosphate isomerase/epimerase
MRRRELLLALGGAALTPTLQRLAAMSPRADWTGGMAQLDRIGIQLYTVRDEMAKGADAAITAIAKLGYKQVEFAGLYGKSPKDMRTLIDSLGLTSPSSHIDLGRWRKDPAAVYAEANALGNKYVVMPWLSPEQRGGTDSWKTLAADCNRWAEGAKKAGLGFAYHNHDFEFDPLPGGGTAYDILTKETDASLVKFEMDLYWTTKAGQDPIALFKKWPGRFPMVHVKDRTADGKMTDVGSGVLQFVTWFKQAKLGGIQYYYVECDNPPVTSMATAKASYDYLAKLRWS